MKQNKNILFFISLVILIVLLYNFWLYKYFSLQLLQQHRQLLKAFVFKHYFISLFLYLITSIVSVAFFIPIIAPVVILGGFLFDIFWAVIIANIGVTIGAIISFSLCKKSLNQQRIGKYNNILPFFKKQMQIYGPSFLLILHFLLIIPYVFITFLAVISNVSLATYSLTTVVGFIPAALLYAYTGRKLATIKTIYDFFSFRISLMMFLLIAVALLPVVIKKIKR